MTKKPLTITDTASLRDTILEMVRVRKVQEKAKDVLEEYKDAIRNYLNKNGMSSVSLSGVYATIHRYTETRFDAKAFEADRPNLAKKYKKTVERERFSYGVEKNERPVE